MLRRAWFLFLCLLASSLVATATVHAQEKSATAELTCSGAAHAESDPGQSPANGDQAMPHHGTCHGHAFALDMVAATLAAPSLAALPPFRQPSGDAALRAIGPGLRPPRG